MARRRRRSGIPDRLQRSEDEVVSFALLPHQPMVMRVYIDESHVDNNI